MPRTDRAKEKRDAQQQTHERNALEVIEMHSIKKSMLSVVLAMLTFLGIIAGTYTVPAAHAAEETAATEDYHLWRQMDPRWADVAIGGSTIRRSGCLVTSIAILAAHSGTRDPNTFNPGTFANDMSALGGFTSGGAIASWATITQVLPEVRVVDYTSFKSSDQAGKAAEIKARMDQGYYVVVNVNWHWVFVEGVVGDDVYMIDPAKDDVLMFDAYDNANIIEYEVFTGKNPPPAFSAPVEGSVYETGEYCYTGEDDLDVYAAGTNATNSDPVAQLRNGHIVNVIAINADNGSKGYAMVNGIRVWLDLTQFTYAVPDDVLTSGDINSDGAVDCYDLALVNEYIKSLTYLPDGVSILSSCEIEAADINGDGIVDNADILGYLELVC